MALPYKLLRIRVQSDGIVFKKSFMNSAGCLSQEEFLSLQEQLLTLKNQNYELQDTLKKLKAESANSSNSTKNEAILFASKLINRNKDKEINQRYEAEVESLKRKLEAQEEEFRLQQKTLFEEMNMLSTQNAELKIRVDGPSHNSNDNIQTTLDNQNASSSQTNDNKLNEQLILLTSTSDRYKKEIIEKDTLITALEDQLLEYKEKKTICSNKLEEQESLLATVQEELSLRDNRESLLHAQIDNLNKELEKSNSLNSSLRSTSDTFSNSIKTLEDELNKCNILITDQKKNIDQLKNDSAEYKERLVVYEKEQIHLKSIIAEKDTDLDSVRLQLLNMEEEKKNLQNESQQQMEKLKKEIDAQAKSYLAEKNLDAKNWGTKEEELVKEMNDLKLNSSNLLQENLLLMETRFQLEISDLKKQFDIEKEELNNKIMSLEEVISRKDEDKNLALKKQTAVLKELQRALKEEKKRSDSLEKSKGDRDEWQVLESDERSNQTFDGNESVSSISALESDNAELINRLTSMHRVYSDSTEKIIHLESENSRLKKEITEKNELIEHWIKNKPLSIQSSSLPKQEGVFRKILTSLPVNESANDMKEMNKKLQRMLEETLSKNIILQRDLQTLLERTEI